MIAKNNGMSISEIFDLHGEAYFRNEETNLLKEVGSEKNKIVSCGGGVAMREVNVQEMRKSGKVVLLTAKPETILERVKENHDRPLLENNKTVEYVSELMEKRRPAYEAAADIVIATDGKSANEICEEIIAQVKKFAGSGCITLASRQIRLTIGQKIAAIQQPASCHTSMRSSSQEKKVIVRSLFRKELSILHSWDSLRRHREILFLRQNTPSVRVWKQFTHL